MAGEKKRELSLGARTMLASHMASANGAAGALSDPCFARFRLEEDTVVFDVRAGDATGSVNLSLHERSRYPRSGALAFADGSDALLRAVESVSERISSGASLPAVLEQLGRALGSEAVLAQLPSYSQIDSADGGASSSAGAGGSGDPPEGGGDASSDDEDEDAASGASSDDDYDLGFKAGDELAERLLRLRLAWEEKDTRRREAARRAVGLDPPADDSAPAAAPAAAAPEPAESKEPKRRGDKGDKQTGKRGAASQIFSSAEATRILCNELVALIRERAEGFAGRPSLAPATPAGGGGRASPRGLSLHE